ncbi:MAG: hypothetical protein GXP43_00355 [bacterium]|nr:hypothetical protein [bacterium]
MAKKHVKEKDSKVKGVGTASTHSKKQAGGSVVNTTFLLVFLVGLMIGVAGSSFYWYQQKTKGFLPIDQLTKKVETYVTNNVFKGQIQVKIKEMEPMGSLAKFKIEIPNRGEFTSYVTRQGDMLFPEGMDMKAVSATPEAQAPQATDSGAASPSGENKTK